VWKYITIFWSNFLTACKGQATLTTEAEEYVITLIYICRTMWNNIWEHSNCCWRLFWYWLCCNCTISVYFCCYSNGPCTNKIAVNLNHGNTQAKIISNAFQWSSSNTTLFVCYPMCFVLILLFCSFCLWAVIQCNFLYIPVLSLQWLMCHDK